MAGEPFWLLGGAGGSVGRLAMMSLRCSRCWCTRGWKPLAIDLRPVGAGERLGVAGRRVGRVEMMSLRCSAYRP